MNNKKPLQGSFLLSNLIKIFCLSLFLFSLASLNPASAKIITIGSSTDISTDMIGIGTSIPEARLHIIPSTNMEGLIIKASNYSPFIVKNSSNVEVFKIDENGSITSSGSLVGSNNYWNLSGSNLYASNTSWKLGIGISNPGTKLDVVNNTTYGDVSTTYATTLTNSTIKIGNSNTGTALLSGISLDANSAWVQVQHSNNSFKNLLLNPLGGNIGIGTTAPATALDVYGKVKTTSGGTVYNINSGRWLDFSGTLTDSLKLFADLYSTAGELKTDGTGVNYMMGSLGVGTANPGTYKLNVVGNTYINGTLTAKSITDVKRAINSVSSNIGTPTVEEMALFHGQFNNKFRFFPATLQEESTDGVNWVTSTRLSANQLADLMLGEGQTTSATAIPAPAVGGSGYYRLTWDAPIYMLLNAFYAYNSTNGNQVNFKIEAYHNTNGWTEITNGTISNWPGHTYIPHNTIYFNPTNPTQSGKVRVTFSITSATYANAFTLYGIEWFGGYPAGMRNVQSYDRNKNVTFPSAIKGGSGSASVPTFSFASDSDTGMYTGGSNIIRFSTGGSDKMTIYNNGNVGIGTTAPQGKLEIVGSSVNTGNSDTNIITGNSVNTGYYNSLAFRQNSTNTGARITSGNNTLYKGFLAFETSRQSSAGHTTVEAMRIDGAGNVGIGTTNPLDPLHVNGNVRIGALLNCSGTGSAVKTDASGRLVCGTISGGVTGAGTTNYLTKWSSASTLGTSTIYDNGTNVGIGTTNPGAKLDIFATATTADVFGLKVNAAVDLGDSNYSEYGGHFVANGTDVDGSYGVYAVSSPVGYNSASYGVYGRGIDAGVYGVNLDGGYGLYGYSTGIGIFGYSSSYQAIYALSGSGFGIYSNAPKNYFSGNIGIGTVSPGTKLDVNGSINLASSGKLGFGGVNANWMDFTSSYFRLLMGGSGAAPIKVGGLVVSGDYGATAPAGGAYIQGNLGVGVSNPAQKLTISGASLSGNTSQTNISAFTGNGLRINGSIGDSSQDAITYQSGSAGAGAAIAFGRDGSYGTFISMYTNPTTSGSQGSIVERLRVTQNGNVGIGTTNPVAKLTVQGGDDASSVGVLEVVTTGGTNLKLGGNTTYSWVQSHSSKPLYINPLGNNVILNSGGSSVGIGVTNPQTKLHISQPTPDTDGLIISTNTINPDSAQHYGAISFQDYGTKTGNYSQIRSWSNLHHHWGSQLSFHVTTGAGPTLIEAMRINHNGSVGIGTDNPIYKLNVHNEGGSSPAAFVMNISQHATTGQNTNSNALVRFYHQNGFNSRPWIIGTGSNIFGHVDNFGIQDGYDSSAFIILERGTGKVSIGTTSTTYKLTVGGDVGASAFNYTSDRSLKKNIKTIANPVDKIMNLRGVSFNWKNNGEPSIGLIAQEVEKVFPELVTGDSLKSVQYGNLVAPLIEAVKEQQREIELLNKRIEALEARK